MMQLDELIDGVEKEEKLLFKDYVVKKDPIDAYNEIKKLSYEELFKTPIIAGILGMKETDNFDEVTIYARGYRVLSKIPRMPANIVDNLVKKFKSFQHLLSADIKELDTVDGIGEVRARTIIQSLKRMQEQLAFDNMMI